VYRPKSNNNASQDSIEPDEVHYQEMSNGLSNQIFEIDPNLKFPVLKLNYLNLSEGRWDEKKKKWKWDKWEKWERVDDLLSSLPYNKHYVILDGKKGLIKFGDGENGKVPPKKSKIQVEYKFGNMQQLWIEQGKYFTFDQNQMNENSSDLSAPFYHKLFATNYLPSSAGRRAETIGEAIIRARRELIVPYKAVTKTDFEYIAKNTPGLRVGKVKAITSSNQEEENTIIIAALPYSPSSYAKRLYSNEDFREAISQHLEKHKLLTTRIRVIEPKYVGISVNTKIKLALKNFEQKNAVKKRIAECLDSYFSPLPTQHAIKEEDGGDWDFGRNIYRSKMIALIQSWPEIETVLELSLQGSGDNGFHTDIDGNIIMDDLNLVYLKDLVISFL
jgi:predicted phage baseplate assembly protein